jgi:hypothetical protein
MNRAQTLAIATALVAALGTWLLLSKPGPGTGADPDSVNARQSQVQAETRVDKPVQAHTMAPATRANEGAESRDESTSLEGNTPAGSQLDTRSGRGSADAGGRTPASARGLQDGASAAIQEYSKPVAPAQGVRATPRRAGMVANTDMSTPIPDTVFDSTPGTHFEVQKQIELAEANGMGSAAGALSFWMRPDWDDGNHDDATFVQLGDSGIFVTKVGDSLRFEFIDETGSEQSLDFPISSWKRGHWRFIVATWDSGTYALYVDGKLIAEQSLTNLPDFQQETRVYVGTDAAANTAVAPAVVNRVKVLNRGVDPGEVAAAFRAGILSPDR